MNLRLFPADQRGHAQHGWLESYHSFSFASYYNPECMHFGALRVLNDDWVAPGMGFGTHPHDNMEIISIPLSGDLEHRDSMGNRSVIKEGEIQVMSAGTGITHSEYNPNADREVRFLQIWLFPRSKNLTPRYDQKTIADLLQPNELSVVLSPNAQDKGVWIHQDAWFSMGEFDQSTELIYESKKSGNGAYLFVLEGSVEVEGHNLGRRDAIGVWNYEQLALRTSPGTRLLLMDVPMQA
jgi:redox-sensitive bicupin YhaK (pirin superfamily)